MDNRCVEETMWDGYGYGCDLSFDCNDEFEECEGTRDELRACEDQFRQETAAWCEENCPNDPDCAASEGPSNTWGRSCALPCDSDSQCASGSYCDSERCAADCTSDLECDPLETRDLARGRREPTSCGSDGQCPSGTYCDGICTFDCRAGQQDCPLGQACSLRGRCEAVECSTDSSRPPGTYCGRSICAFDCSASNPLCPPGQVCDVSRGRCEAPAPIEPGQYTFTCDLDGLPIPLPVVIKINADDPGFEEGTAADLTTLLNYIVAPDVIGLLPTLAPDAELSELTAEVGVEGGTPGPIDHTAEGLPFSPVAEFDSDEVTTSVTPDADEVSLSVIAFSTTITGLPDTLVPGGEIALTAGEGDCGALEPVEGSGPLTFPVVRAD